MNSQLIDTRQGTANQYSFSNGNCLPYTGVPFGMNYFAPQTASDRGSWWFHPEDRTFQGFRLTHQPSPWMGDFSHFVMQPISGSLQEATLTGAQSSYRPEESVFTPSRLEITSLRYQTHSILVPSMYGGALEINYQQANAGLLLSLPGKVQLYSVDEHSLKGSLINYSGSEDENFTFYFTLVFQSPIVNANEILTTTAQDQLLLLKFGDCQQQFVQFGFSFISSQQAELNFQREQEWSLSDYQTSSEEQWQKYLNRIQVTHHDKKQVSTFYHCLYRSFLFPQRFYEIDANLDKIHYDTTAKEVKTGPLYTNNGFWDTYKTVYPLFSLIAVPEYEEMLEGFLNSYLETGFLPKWLSPDERGLMPGTLIDAVIADAASKNIAENLLPQLYEAMKKSATVQSEKSNYGRQGTLDYLKYGYVPNTYHESVNHTLDYCYSDFCISQVAKKLDQKEEATFYRSQAKNYLNIFDPVTGFMRAKDPQGHFTPDFSPTRWGKDYAEGSAWQSSFSVFHDFSGLIQAAGGTAPFQEKLTELFNQKPTFDVSGYGFEIHEMSEMAAVELGQMAISNQPSFHLPFLFSYLGKPANSQPLLKQLMTNFFDDGFRGFPGDEDNGSTSAWFVFNSLGFYPVCPGTSEYVIGIPLFDQVKVQLSSGEELTLTASPNHVQQQFLHQTSRNGHLHTPLFFTHEDLIQGGTINYQLGIVPNERTVLKEELPFSLSE